MSQCTDIRGRKLNPRYKHVGISAFAETQTVTARQVYNIVTGRKKNPAVLAAWHRFVEEDLEFVKMVNRNLGIKRPDRTRKGVADRKFLAELKARGRGEKREGIADKMKRLLANLPAGKEQAS